MRDLKQGGQGRDVQTLHEMGSMHLDRPGTYSKVARNALVRTSAHQPEKHFPFASRKPGQPIGHVVPIGRWCLKPDRQGIAGLADGTVQFLRAQRHDEEVNGTGAHRANDMLRRRRIVAYEDDLQVGWASPQYSGEGCLHIVAAPQIDNEASRVENLGDLHQVIGVGEALDATRASSEFRLHDNISQAVTLNQIYLHLWRHVLDDAANPAFFARPGRDGKACLTHLAPNDPRRTNDPVGKPLDMTGARQRSQIRHDLAILRVYMAE